MTDIDWEEEDLNRQRIQPLLRMPTEGDGVLILDDTGFAKQGLSSIGVARQYSGTLGKTGNCQVTVNCHYAERTLAWSVATRLYLPEHWAYDAERRCKAKVPEAVTFRTKPQIALGVLDRERPGAGTAPAASRLLRSDRRTAGPGKPRGWAGQLASQRGPWPASEAGRRVRFMLQSHSLA